MHNFLNLQIQTTMIRFLDTEVENIEKKPPRGILMVSIVTVISGALLINLLLPFDIN